MSLSTEDLAAISQLLDQKLEAQEVIARRRRRFWIWFWTLTFILSTAASAWAAKGLIERAQDELTRINQEFSETKLAYQRQLEHDKKLQAERAAAVKTVDYKSEQTQAEHEAGLLSGLIGLMGSKTSFEKKWENIDASDPAQMDAFAKDLGGIMDQGLKPLGQIVLRNTDPAHNTKDEKMRQDGPAPGETNATPINSPTSTATPLETPSREPAPAPALVVPK